MTRQQNKKYKTFNSSRLPSLVNNSSLSFLRNSKGSRDGKARTTRRVPRSLGPQRDSDHRPPHAAPTETSATFRRAQRGAQKQQGPCACSRATLYTTCVLRRTKLAVRSPGHRSAAQRANYERTRDNTINKGELPDYTSGSQEEPSQTAIKPLHLPSAPQRDQGPLRRARRL